MGVFLSKPFLSTNIYVLYILVDKRSRKAYNIFSEEEYCMLLYITNLTLSGIKNIDTEISIYFHNKKLPKEFIVQNHNIKAIYGENGAGKSAMIHAMDIYKSIMLERNYLNDRNNNQKLNHLINKLTNELKVQISFVLYDEIDHRVIYMYQHQLHLSKDKDETFYVKEEYLAFKKPSAKAYEMLVHHIDGELQLSKYLNDEFKLKCMNLLTKQSVLSVFIYSIQDLSNTHNTYGSMLIKQMIFFFIFVNSIEIFMNESDRHDDYKGMAQMSNYISEISNKNEYEATSLLKPDVFLKKYYMINGQTDVIKKQDLHGYLSKIERLTMFMKLLKEDLITIEVETKENRDTLFCEKYFVYDGYRINIEFESTGIKKLVTLFDAFEAYVNGKIVFIDELDANIHDVYLLKLLEYFILYGKGQLCFTTHNLGPMEILRNQKHSIDFLSQDAHITSWKKNGHYSVIKLYRDGMIEHSPFNIEAIDFSGIFEIEEE